MNKLELYPPSTQVNELMLKAITKFTVNRFCKKSAQKVTNSFSEVFFRLRQKVRKPGDFFFCVFEQALNDSVKKPW